MENLSYISSAGLRVIMQAVRKMQRRDARLALCSLSADVRSIFQTSGFDQLVDILPSRAAAPSRPSARDSRSPLVDIVNDVACQSDITAPVARAAINRRSSWVCSWPAAHLTAVP